MFKRLTVQQIQNIKAPILVNQINIKKAFFTQNHIFVIENSAPQYLQKITYNNFEIVESIKLPQITQKNSIKSLIQVDGVIIFAVESMNELFYINQKRQTFQIKSHLQPINQISYFALQKQIVTCSDDFTVRVWQLQNGKIIPNKLKHIYSGHHDKVQILCPYSSHNLFASSSKNQLIFWKNGNVQHTIKTPKLIKSLLYCEKSNQCLIFCENHIIYGIQLNQVLNDPKKASIFSILQKQPEQPTSFSPKCCSQIDDSFVVFLENNQLIFLQKNISQIIKRIELTSQKQIPYTMIQICRLVIFANKKGIHLLRI